MINTALYSRSKKQIFSCVECMLSVKVGRYSNRNLCHCMHVQIS